MSQNARQTSTLAKGEKNSSLKERVCGDTYFAIGFCLFIICFTVIAIVNEIYLRLALTEPSMGTIIVARRGWRGGRMVVIHYVNGVQYVGRVRGLSSGSPDIRRDIIREGQQIRILYNPSAPQQIRMNVTGASDTFANIIFFIFMSFFIVFLIAQIKKE